MLLEGKMGHTNRSVQKFTRWAWAAAMTWPETGMGPGHRWNQVWTDWQQPKQQHWVFSAQQQHWGGKTSQLANVWASLQIKNVLKCISHFMERLWGLTPEPYLGGEVRSSSSSTQHHGTSRECLVLWLQPEDNTPGLSLWAAECCPSRHRKPFHILEQFRNKYSDSNVLWP